MKHVESIENRGQNVGIDKLGNNDYPVALKVRAVRNNNRFIGSSSDEDDPFNLLRGKPYPNDESSTLYTQEKFTMPQVVITLKDEQPDRAVKSKKKDSKSHVEDEDNDRQSKVTGKSKSEGKSGRPGIKFSTAESKTTSNHSREKDTTANEENGRKSKENLEVKDRKNDKPANVEDINDAKELISKLVSKCRTFAADHMKKEDMKNSSAPSENHAKLRTIWEWKPKKDQQKTGYRLDIANINLPVKVPNFIRLFKQFCMASSADIRIVIEDTVFHCHKIVLQCYSKYFQTHIRSKAFQKEVMMEIPHDKVNKNVFMDIYIWMLNSPKNCKNNFTNYNVLNLLIASAYLKIAELEKHCWHYINNEQNFDEASAFDLYWEARHANYWPVMELMIKRVKTFFLTLIQTDKFLKLTENELHLLFDSNNIAVHNEIEIFFSLILWLRKRNQPEPWECPLFRLIRFSQMSPIQAVELQSMSELHYITKHYPVNEMIENGLRVAIRREHAKNGHSSFIDPEPQPRNWLRRTILYKSFNEFIDALIKKRNHMKKPNCELIRRETLENLKLTSMETTWTPALNVKK